jgi:hypothetical protein
VGLPVFRVEIAGHAALDADAIGSATMTERAAQIVLPATKHSLHQPFGRVIKGTCSLDVTFDLSLIDCRYVLHFNLLKTFCGCARGRMASSGFLARVSRRQLPNLNLLRELLPERGNERY